MKRLFAEASEVVGKNLEKLCFEGPEAELGLTDNVQPAITLVNLACLHVLREEGISPSAAAGHSLGEYAALCAAGVFTFSDTMRLVQARGAAMREAAERNPGGMTAVFGLDRETLSAICKEAMGAGSVEVANHNSPAQVVLTGSREGLQKAAELVRSGRGNTAVLLSGLANYLTESQKEELVSQDARAGLGPAHRLFKNGCSSSDSNFLNEFSRRMTENLFDVSLPSDMLRKVDMMSMLASIEVRVPMLDERVVEFGLSLPHRLKTDGRRGKLVLRALAEKWLPPVVANHPKIGRAHV